MDFEGNSGVTVLSRGSVGQKVRGIAGANAGGIHGLQDGMAWVSSNDYARTFDQ